MSNNYGFNEMSRDSHLQGIQSSINNVSQSIDNQTYLQAYGKEAYIEMMEKRNFRKQLFWCGLGAFIVGFTLIGLFINGWSMSAFINQLANIVMRWIS